MKTLRYQPPNRPRVGNSLGLFLKGYAENLGNSQATAAEWQQGLTKLMDDQSFLYDKSYPDYTWVCRTVMSYDRYVLLKRFLHITPNNAIIPRGEPAHDPWHKIRPMLDHLNNKLKKHYVSTVNISIDESMIGMKNRHIYIQYLPNKRQCRFGIKKFEVCKAHTGYVHMFTYNCIVGISFLSVWRMTRVQQLWCTSERKHNCWTRAIISERLTGMLSVSSPLTSCRRSHCWLEWFGQILGAYRNCWHTNVGLDIG